MREAPLWFALALAVRGACAWHWSAAIVPPGDAEEYVALARNLVHHGVFGYSAAAPTVFRPPLFPALIAALWHGPDPPLSTLTVVHALLGAATVALVHLMASRHWGSSVARVAALGAALAPMTCRYTALAMSETLFTFLLMGGLFLWGAHRPIGAGVSLGLAALTRAVVLPFIAVIVAIALLPPWRSRFREHAVIAVVCAATIAPWCIRNALELHRAVIVADGGWGSNVLQGTIDVPPFSGNVWSRVLTDPASQVPEGVDPSLRERVLLGRGLERIADDPRHWLVIRARQYPRLYADSGEYVELGRPRLDAVRKVVFLVGNVALIALAVIGCYLGRAFLRATPHLWLFPAYVMIAHLPMWTEARYLLPATPGLIVLAAVGLHLMGCRCRRGCLGSGASAEQSNGARSRAMS